MQQHAIQSRSTQKYSTPKYFPSIHFVPVINAPMFLLLSLKKVSLQKKAWAIEKRKKERKKEKGQVSK
jgi:hypothetical protein